MILERNDLYLEDNNKTETNFTYIPLHHYIYDKIEHRNREVREVCFQESNTIVCGKIKEYDFSTIEDLHTVEPFFGECDIFGF